MLIDWCCKYESCERNTARVIDVSPFVKHDLPCEAPLTCKHNLIHEGFALLFLNLCLHGIVLAPHSPRQQPSYKDFQSSSSPELFVCQPCDYRTCGFVAPSVERNDVDMIPKNDPSEHSRNIIAVLLYTSDPCLPVSGFIDPRLPIQIIATCVMNNDPDATQPGLGGRTSGWAPSLFRAAIIGSNVHLARISR